jgi:ribosomal protein S18 acetylase RimI-like enzyme
VAEVEGRIVGTAEYQVGVDPHESLTLTVTDLGVLPEFQGMGVGGALVDELKRIGKKEGVERVYVSTTIDNIPAMVFHLTHGAKVFHVREDNWDGTGRWGIPTRFDIAFEYEIP